MTPFEHNGMMYQDLGNGNVKVIGPAQPRSGYIPPNQMRVAERKRDVARQDAADARADRNESRQDRTEARASRPAPGEGLMWGPDGQSVTFIPGGVRDPKSPYYRGEGGKPMRQGDGDKLVVDVSQYASLKEAAASFQPEFGGNMLGGMENTAQAMFNVGTPGQREWWSKFAATDNVIRNGLYGASLTDGEKKAYEATTVSPSMSPETIQANLAQRSQIIQSALGRNVNRFRAAGFNGAEIDAALGFYGEDLTPDALAQNIFYNPNAKKKDEVPAAGDVPNQRGNTAAGSQGADRSNVMLGDSVQPNNGGFAAYGSTSRTIDNPVLAGVNEALGKMIAQGATREQLKAFAASKGVPLGPNTKFGNETAVGRTWMKQNPGKTYPVNVDDMSVPMSGFEQFRNNAPQWEDPVVGFSPGTMAATALNAGGMGIPQMLAGDEAFNYLRSQNPGSAFAGDVAGVIGGTSMIRKLGKEVAQRFAPQLLSPGKWADRLRSVAPDATYGAVYGTTTEGDPLTGAALATAGNVGGQFLGKTFKNTLQGVTDPGVRYLTERGTPLTMGQTFGNRGLFGKAMNKMESIPVLGDMFGSRRVDGLQAFEREALKDAVAPVGGNVTMGGRQGLMQAQDAVQQGYSDALSGVNVSPDQQFVQEAGAAMQAGGAVPKFGEDFTYAMNQELGPLFGVNGNLTGPQLQSALQSVGKIRSGFDKNEDAMATYAANATGQMDDAISNLVGRQAPDVMPAYNNAKSAFSNLVPFEKARIGAINQEAITPAQLRRAVTSNTSKFGSRGAAARGDNLTPLMQYGQDILPSSAPNPSGTAQHVLMSAALPTALGGASYGLSDISPTTAGILASIAAMSTKAGQKAVQNLAVRRPDSVRRIGGMFGRRQTQEALGSAGGAAALSYYGN